jgi:hypothetical protein
MIGAFSEPMGSPEKQSNETLALQKGFLKGTVNGRNDITNTGNALGGE